jgi:hypothetical protein
VEVSELLDGDVSVGHHHRGGGGQHLELVPGLGRQRDLARLGARDDALGMLERDPHVHEVGTERMVLVRLYASVNRHHLDDGEQARLEFLG